MATIPLLLWTVTEPLLPPMKGAMGRSMREHRPVLEGAIYRLKKGIPWRCLPPEYGRGRRVHRRHCRWSVDGTWDRIRNHWRWAAQCKWPCSGVTAQAKGRLRQ